MDALKTSLVLLTTLVLSASAVGCVKSVPRERMALLRVVAEPDTVTVYINDQFAGSARVLAAKPKALRPGIKYITFKAPDHFPHDVRLDLKAGETVIKMKLRPIPP